MYQIKSSGSQNLNSSFKKPKSSWKQVNVPHLDGSYIADIQVPTARDVWGQIGLFSKGGPSIYYVLTHDGGCSWKLDSLPLSTEYGVSGYAAIDGYTCYAGSG